MCFNPCSRGCFARSPPRGVHIAMRSGFNPCSRGCFARRITGSHPQSRRYWFQSLFSWMFRSKAVFTTDDHTITGFNPCSRGCFARSLAAFGFDCDHSRFNPCSRGCFARRGNRHTRPPSVPGFNPCSRGCFARSARLAVSELDDAMFQSLFSWMFRSK